MFSLLLSVLIINNKLNNVAITEELRNFAIFCIVLDTFLVLKYGYEMYRTSGSLFARTNYVVLGAALLYGLCIAQAAMIVVQPVGSTLTQETFIVAIVATAITALAILSTQSRKMSYPF